MKIIIFIQLITLVSSVRSDTTDKALEAYLRVGEYLKTHRQTPALRTDSLENSNSIGIGYDLLHGSPVCYTAGCHMNSFLQPIFELNYVKSPLGGCTTKFIPEGVAIQCLPGSERTTSTQVIDSLEHLKQVTENGFEIGGGGKYKLITGSYNYSKETRYMIDKIYKEKSEILYTTLKVSYVKLSMFDLRMNLSKYFRVAIENLTCCEYNENVEKYIYDHIFRYFGYSYVRTLMLGGIAQQNLILYSSNATTLEQNGINKVHQANTKFYVSFGMKNNASQSSETEANFTNSITDSYTTRLGGDPAADKMDDWVKTIKTNPVIIKFGLSYIFDILTQEQGRFPNDPDISNKSKMIERALNNYIDMPISCYKNCSGHGTCEDTGYFQFGECKCERGWLGVDCSKAEEKPKPIVLSGTLCGSGNNLACNGRVPESGCQGSWNKTEWNHCKRIYTSNQESDAGTICGYRIGNLTISCDGRNPYSDACPFRYQRHQQTAATFCYKVVAYSDDLPGTICGMEVMMYTEWKADPARWTTITEVACGGYYPGRGSCPPDYVLRAGYYKTVVACGILNLGNCDRTYKYSFCSKK